MKNIKNNKKNIKSNKKNIKKTVYYSYYKIINIIIKESKNIKLHYNISYDGRVDSAIKENIFLENLVNNLKKYKDIKIDYPKIRNWYDIRINGIPINLKITNGNNDNVFNKIAILYTLSGNCNFKSNMNYNNFCLNLVNLNIKKKRNKKTEYHFLVINKLTNNIMIKSLLDIHSYKSNPSNILQINWNYEYNLNYITPNNLYNNKIYDLLNTIQISINKCIESMKTFSNLNINNLIN